MEKTIEIPECKDKAYSGMDYEKEYKAMVQRARELYESGNALTKLQMGIVCPELAESKDEIIRRRLINLIKELAAAKLPIATGGYFVDGQDKDYIAYLERQKEKPNSADSIPADCASNVKCEDEHNKPGDFVFELRQIFSRHRYADIYGECVDDEEGMAREIMALCERQKPAEWSEKDSSMLSDIVGYITGAGSSSGITKQERVDFLYGLPKRFNLQLKQEWSEEDRRKINRIYDILGHAADDKGFLTSKRIIGDKEAIELQDFLKSLLPSWKPSEQEKGAIRTAIHILTGERTFPKAVAQLQNILNAFEGKKSRKDWKPSEEQMLALGGVLDYLEESDNEDADIIRELINDLKKL